MLTKLLYQIPVVLQECPIVPSLRDALRTSKVNVHRVTMSLDFLCSSKKLIWIIGTELGDQLWFQQMTVYA